MKKAKIGIIVDSLNSSKQIFDFIKASKNSKNYEVSHLIVQKCNTKNNLSLIEKSKIPELGINFLGQSIHR